MWQFLLGFVLGAAVVAAVAIPEIRDWIKSKVMRS